MNVTFHQIEWQSRNRHRWHGVTGDLVTGGTAGNRRWRRLAMGEWPDGEDAGGVAAIIASSWRWPASFALPVGLRLIRRQRHQHGAASGRPQAGVFTHLHSG